MRPLQLWAADVRHVGNDRFKQGRKTAFNWTKAGARVTRLVVSSGGQQRRGKRARPHHDDSLGRPVPVAQAVASEQSQAGVEEQRGRVPQVQERLHQRDGPHGPVAAELRGIQQQPRVHGEKVVEGHLSRGGGTDCRWVIEPAKGQRRRDE